MKVRQPQNMLLAKPGPKRGVLCRPYREAAERSKSPLKLVLPAVLYDAPLHGAVMAHGMTGPHYSCRPIDLRGGIGIGSLRPVARPRHAVRHHRAMKRRVVEYRR